MVDIDAVRDWLGRLPGGSLAGRYGDDWDTFTKGDKPVVTLFGSYDTGKSSLLRRLIVDAGGEVPAWLTISARHETFEVNGAEVGGCVIRDTPGFSVGASDIRAQNNTRRATAAVGLTDVGVVVVTSQLATAERDLLQEVFTREWPAGTLWVVISRFDEAANPMYGLGPYREMAARKVRELREIFTLDEQARVFVVSPDPFGLAGALTGLGRETWDAHRAWDGMGDLADAIEALPSSDPAGRRHAAGQRYWTVALDETLTELRRQLADYSARAEVATSGINRRQAAESELDAIDRAARAGLEGLVDEVLRRSWDPAAGADEPQAEVQRVLGEWFTRHEARLQRLRQSIRKSTERDRAHPSWSDFATLVANLESGAAAPADAGGVAGRVESVGPMLLGVLKALTDAAEPLTGKKTRTAKAVEGVGRHLGTVEAAIPLAVYGAKIFDDFWTDRARAHQDRAAAEKREQLAVECTRRALDAWQPFVDDVRDEIITETSDRVDLDAGLHRLVEQLRAAVDEGESLLRR